MVPSKEMDEVMLSKAVLLEVAKERGYQMQKFGNDFDDLNKPNDWIAYITAYASRVYGGPEYKDGAAPVDFRQSMVKAAALAIAAIEAHDRKVSK